jgi:peptidoglycan/xylan/chitin deacetylase (PgdA/CDA1 family)
MKCSSVFFTRFAALVTLAALCLSTTSCLEKLKELLPKPAPKEAVEKPLTEEEQKLQKTMEGQDVFSDSVEKAVPVAEQFDVNKSSLVSVLCYHDFADKPSRSDMVITYPVFRQQMQALKDAGIAVIPMSDLLAWKRGEKNIPEESVVITMDDGWVGVYQYAFPILKEFNYPFTFFLYKNYVARGGRSMTISQIKEMLDYGAEIGSHSVSHQALTAKHGKTDEQYNAWLQDEIVGSKKFLEETLGVKVKAFAYPYGNKTPEIAQMCLDAGYEVGVTVNPQKCTWDTPPGLIPRFVQIGDKDVNFKLATNFHGGGNSIANSKFIKTDEVDAEGKKLVELNPPANATITNRLPVIEANLSHLGGVIPETIVLRVSGFGPVPVEFDPATQVVSYHVVQRMRLDTCTATLSFRRVGAEKDEVVNWQFKIDRKASYLPPSAEVAPLAPKDAAKASTS